MYIHSQYTRTHFGKIQRMLQIDWWTWVSYPHCRPTGPTGESGFNQTEKYENISHSGSKIRVKRDSTTCPFPFPCLHILSDSREYAINYKLRTLSIKRSPVSRYVLNEMVECLVSVVH